MASEVADNALQVDNYAVRGIFSRRRPLGLLAALAALGLAVFAGYVNQRVVRTEWCGRAPGAAFVTANERAASLCRALVPTWKHVAAPALGAGRIGTADTVDAPRSFMDGVRQSLPLSAPIAVMLLALVTAFLRRRPGYVWLGVLAIGLMLAGTNATLLALSQGG
ncbi:MAG TPA: hypothetical protein VKT31_10505 [Solirubrobacteraceae bacterium]|nr:hypothetical protein [Solirubrobacteraceae bacterium]